MTKTTPKTTPKVEKKVEKKVVPGVRYLIKGKPCTSEEYYAKHFSKK